MIITLDNAYQSEFLLQPARNSAGELKGLELSVNFTGVGSDVRIPTDLVIPRLTPAEELLLFHEKLQLLDTCKLFFIQHQLIAWINITPVITEYLLTKGNAVSLLERYPFVELTVNESYPGLNNGKDDLHLARMAIHFPLVLANAGAGGASLKAVYDGLFKRVILDKGFIQQRACELSFEPFLRAILWQISPHCQSVIVSGIDDHGLLQRVIPFNVGAMQGALWPAVPAEHVTTLVQG
ncbi:EAL domain-containing protein [unidentified bacterial endosymbiont]|jgi:EAL domain-containing protein (putative c-di-GMP-specific phosphodiesterase class I)|uniref:EAL domain-containing protein n=1 Tax=unidentified bacterial endosymbiont TaxID=2355 RepID=UPI0020A2306C|nr:EAL domain-containing protein [unidentified bacterial endosymbiont]